MLVCPISIRLAVAPGEIIPDILYTCENISNDQRSSTNFSSLAELHVNALAGHEYASISPMKPSKNKAETPKDIVTDGMSEHDRRELASKLQGRRNFREIRVETYTETQSDADKNEENSIGNSAKQYLKNKEIPNTKNEQNDGNSNDVSNNKLYSEIVSEATTQLLRRSSNSISSSKDDHELTEILQMSDNVATATGSRPSSSMERYTPSFRSVSENSHSTSPNIQTTNLPFFSGNPAVEITHGIIHLYKANYMMKVDEDLTPPPTNTLCMLAVPATVDTHALLEFTAGFCDTIKQLRIIRDRTPSQYMVLLTFSSRKAARNFYLTYNDQAFSSLTEEEVCHLAFVASVEALSSVHDTNKPPGEAKGLLPFSENTELPNCVLCLERMDESVRGVLTILCNHSFHGSCLQKWEDLCCPVCRYLQTPEPHTDNKCLVCGSVEDLWICLVCGHVGCGRYTTEHAQHHYMETQHNYAMALSDNRVWDYAGDYFVHRLFQNKEDGKLVEHKGPDGDSEDRAAKIEAIQLECMYLLTSQLDSQRKYYEERLSRVEEMAESDRKATQTQLSEAVNKSTDLDSKVLALQNERALLEKRSHQLSAKYSSSLKELTTEKELNEGLRENQVEWRKKVKDLEDLSNNQQKEIGDLKEQLRDVMFYLEAQNTLDKADPETREEIQSGQIVVGASGEQKKKRKSKKK